MTQNISILKVTEKVGYTSQSVCNVTSPHVVFQQMGNTTNGNDLKDLLEELQDIFEKVSFSLVFLLQSFITYKFPYSLLRTGETRQRIETKGGILICSYCVSLHVSSE